MSLFPCQKNHSFPDSLAYALSSLWPVGNIIAIHGPFMREICEKDSHVFCRGSHMECRNATSAFYSSICSTSPTVECINAGLSLEEICSSLFEKRLSRVFPNSAPAIGGSYLVVGCGALGNFCASLLALEGARQIDLIDPDIIEQTNLNRQILLYGGIGKPKAIVLAERLRTIRPNLHCTSKVRYFQDKDAHQKYDCIFSCVDNVQARIQISNAAECYRVPLVNGGTSARMGNAKLYVPGKTQSIRKQNHLDALVNVQSQSCREATPSVVIPNMIIGGLMIQLYKEYFHYDRISEARYSPADGIEFTRKHFL